MKNKTKGTLKIVIPVILAIAFGIFTFKKLPVDEMVPYFKSANYLWIGVGTFLGLLSHLSRAYRWQYLLEPLGYKIKLPNSIMAVFIAYLANYGIPRSGEILRATVATNYENIPFEKGFGTIIAERVADVVVMFAIIGITLLLQFQFIYNLLINAIGGGKLIVVGVVGLVLVMILYFILRKSRSSFIIKVRTFVKGLVEGITSILKLKRKWQFIFHTLFIWGMYLSMFYVTTFAIPELEWLPIGAILVAFISASFTIAATNGGIFVYPLAVMAAFSLFNLPEDPSYAFGWVMWTSQTILIIILGSLSFLLLPLYNKNKLAIG
ncbi:lysylphosphatidylglycerol synthase transmembrane domain-containing protein [Aegicerativicinus sediminis]